MVAARTAVDVYVGSCLACVVVTVVTDIVAGKVVSVAVVVVGSVMIASIVEVGIVVGAQSDVHVDVLCVC